MTMRQPSREDAGADGDAPAPRTGEQYLNAIQDDRTILVDGRRVVNVAKDPRFKGIADTVARMYDFAADPGNDMGFECAETGGHGLKPYMIPRSAADFAARRASIQKWSALTRGFVGRGPDHFAGYLAGFASAPHVFDRQSHDGSANVLAWYRKIVDGSLFVAYAITPPQTSRVKATAADADGPLQAAVVGRDDRGVVVRGAQMLATSAAVADLLFVSCIQPLGADDTDHAFSLVLPVDTPGLRLYCRRPYAHGSGDGFDYPLTARFDESDAIVVLDDVLVPWENVFVCQDVDGTRAQFYETPAHALANHQAQLRLVTKLQFILGLARKVCAIHRTDALPAVMERLGELASLIAMVEAGTVAAEARAGVGPHGVMVPARRFLYGAMGMQAEVYPRVIQIVRELVGGGVIQLPSSRLDLLDEQTEGDMRRFMRAAGHPADGRVQLLKLVWDVVGSEFGGRHQQYEMFYAGPPFVARMMSFRNYDFDDAVRAVDTFLATYGPADPDGRDPRPV
jgi:4-hydroxyphenylacetate 3-monooxygenase